VQYTPFAINSGSSYNFPSPGLFHSLISVLNYPDKFTSKICRVHMKPLQLYISTAPEWGHITQRSFFFAYGEATQEVLILNLLFIIICIYYSKTDKRRHRRRRLITWCFSLRPYAALLRISHTSHWSF
jgi:hypothetical protein